MNEISRNVTPSVFKCDYTLLARRIEFVTVDGGTLIAFSSTAARNELLAQISVTNMSMCNRTNRNLAECQ
jgi:hypothetical protein